MQLDIIPLAGGVDSVATPILVTPGKLLSSTNYEPDIYGGYRRMGGIERFDGQSRPSDANYSIAEVETSGEFSVGDTITGVTSSETVVVLVVVSSTELVVTKVSGDFTNGETLNVSGSPEGTLTQMSQNAAVTGELHATYKNLAADEYRADILKVPGSGVVRGVWFYNGDIYAFRDNAGATECVMHKATTSGWSAISFGEELQFDNAVGEIFEGDIVTGVTSGASGEVQRALLRTGTWSSNGEGTLVFDSITGDFQDDEDLQTGEELDFNNAVGEIFVGDTVTGATSGATGEVKSATLTSGTWSSAGAGTLVFHSVSGDFQNAENLQVSAVTKADADGTESALIKANANGTESDITLQPGGRFVFDNINFAGTTATKRMYFADGVNFISEFDGTRLVPIRTGIGNDSPKYIVGHKNHLFMAVESSVQVSGIGDPYSWTALTGGAELGLGEDVTGFLPQVGDATTGVLVISTDRRVFILYGNDTSDFNLVLHSPETGAKPYTQQNIGYAHWLDARGIAHLQSSDSFGGFEMSILSRAMQNFIDRQRGLETASCIVRRTNQYRLFFNDGKGLIMYAVPTQAGMQVSLMPFDYGIDFYINTVCSFVEADGTERMVASGSDGYVYELDKGTSLDGEPISSHLFTVFVHSKSVRMRKRYRRTVLQMRSNNTAHLNVGYDLSYGALDPSVPDSVSMNSGQSGGFWDSFTWDEFTWDAAYMDELNVDTPGTGESIAIIVAGETDEDEPYTIHTCMLHYLPGRLNR